MTGSTIVFHAWGTEPAASVPEKAPGIDAIHEFADAVNSICGLKAVAAGYRRARPVENKYRTTTEQLTEQLQNNSITTH